MDLVPDFVSVQRDKTTPCLYLPFRSGGDPESKALARRLANSSPTTYRVAVGFTIEGVIDEFYGEGTLTRISVQLWTGVPADGERRTVSAGHL